MTAAEYAAGAFLIVCACYQIALLVVAVRFRRLRDEGPQADVSGLAVSILVPVEGAEPGLDGNLEAYLRLDHRGPVQLVVGSLDPADAALETARRVAARHPEADLRIVAGGPGGGPNRKAALLAQLARHARHPIVDAIDSDVRVRPDYLSRLLPMLLRPGVGLVSCMYRAPRPRTLAQTYEALCINTDFTPSVVLARALGRRDLALGASLLLRRSTLERVGGFAALTEYLADDHRLGELVRTLGLEVALAPHVVESDPNPRTLAAGVRHQVRWARTLRACAPLGYLGSIVSHGTTFALAALALPVAPLLAYVAAGLLALRLLAAVTASRVIGARPGWALLLVPVRDVVATAIWAVSLVGRHVEWRGHHYRIVGRGRLQESVAGGVWTAVPPPLDTIPGQSLVASDKMATSSDWDEVA